MLDRIGYNFLRLFVVLAFTGMIEGVVRDVWKRLQLATRAPRQTINENKLDGAVIVIRERHHIFKGVYRAKRMVKREET